MKSVYATFFVFFISSSQPQCCLVAQSFADLLLNSVQIRLLYIVLQRDSRDLNKNYSNTAVCVCLWEREQEKLTVPGAAEGSASETKAKLPQALAGSRGKRCFSSLPPCLSLPWAGRARAEPFGRFCVRSCSPFVGTTGVGNALCQHSQPL